MTGRDSINSGNGDSGALKNNAGRPTLGTDQLEQGRSEILL